MWIPDSAAKSLVGNISKIIKNKPHLIADDVREKLEELKSELDKLRLLMPNFFYNDGRFDLRDTVKSIAGVLEKAEDVVDYVCKFCSCRTSMLNRMFFTDLNSRRYQISKAKRWIEEACCKVRDINEEIMKKGYDHVLHSHDQAIVNLQDQNFSTARSVGEERVVGFDGAAKKVVELLTEGAECLEVISIVGMLGMGKTTLAKMVYDDLEVQSQYKIRVFIYYSSDYDKREVLLKILTSFTLGDDEVVGMNEHSLQKHVYEQLEGKQYLVVLDGIVVEHDWERLKRTFPDVRNKRCRVLITTRSEGVAEYAANRRDAGSCVHRMDFLTLESSKELLRWRVFGENNCPVELQEHEKDIVIKCYSLPLALLSVAAMIMKHPDRVDWWKTVSDSIKDYWGKDVGKAAMAIYPAYAHLPNLLKPCFLYLAVFGTDFEISVWKLVRLWISEGFILEEECGCLSLEDIGERYLEELVYRNFVMVLRKRSNGKIGMCKMNGTFYDFCRIEAAEENLIRKFMYRRHISLPQDSILDKCRRIGMNADTLDFSSGNTITDKGTRSFLMFSRAEIAVCKKSFSCIPESFKLLKVLEAGSLFVRCLPDQLWSLVLLKYLAISGRIESLPSTLSDIWNLQTLKVNTTFRTLQIEADIWEMPYFRHLHTNAAATFPCQITSKGDNGLQTLCCISPECCQKEVFYQTRKLKKLGISGIFTERFMSNLLVDLQKLEYLENLKVLNWKHFPGLPSKISLPRQLKKLTLGYTRLEWKEMLRIGKLENLEVLKLKEHAFVGERWKTENGGFLCLKHLHIGHMNLAVWEASADHFLELRSLEISGCNQLKRIPHSLADIQSLQSVRLHSSTSPGVTYSLKRIRLVKFL